MDVNRNGQQSPVQVAPTPYRSGKSRKKVTARKSVPSASNEADTFKNALIEDQQKQPTATARKSVPSPKKDKISFRSTVITDHQQKLINSQPPPVHLTPTARKSLQSARKDEDVFMNAVRADHQQRQRMSLPVQPPPVHPMPTARKSLPSARKDVHAFMNAVRTDHQHLMSLPVQPPPVHPMPSATYVPNLSAAPNSASPVVPPGHFGPPIRPYVKPPSPVQYVDLTGAQEVCSDSSASVGSSATNSGLIRTMLDTSNPVPSSRKTCPGQQGFYENNDGYSANSGQTLQTQSNSNVPVVIKKEVAFPSDSHCSVETPYEVHSSASDHGRISERAHVFPRDNNFSSSDDGKRGKCYPQPRGVPDRLPWSPDDLKLYSDQSSEEVSATQKLQSLAHGETNHLKWSPISSPLCRAKSHEASNGDSSDSSSSLEPAFVLSTEQELSSSKKSPIKQRLTVSDKAATPSTSSGTCSIPPISSKKKENNFVSKSEFPQKVSNSVPFDTASAHSNRSGRDLEKLSNVHRKPTKHLAKPSDLSKSQMNWLKSLKQNSGSHSVECIICKQQLSTVLHLKTHLRVYHNLNAFFSGRKLESWKGPTSMKSRNPIVVRDKHLRRKEISSEPTLTASTSKSTSPCLTPTAESNFPSSFMPGPAGEQQSTSTHLGHQNMFGADPSRLSKRDERRRNQVEHLTLSLYEEGLSVTQLTEWLDDVNKQMELASYTCILCKKTFLEHTSISAHLMGVHYLRLGHKAWADEVEKELRRLKLPHGSEYVEMDVRLEETKKLQPVPANVPQTFPSLDSKTRPGSQKDELRHSSNRDTTGTRVEMTHHRTVNNHKPVIGLADSVAVNLKNLLVKIRLVTVDQCVDEPRELNCASQSAVEDPEPSVRQFDWLESVERERKVPSVRCVEKPPKGDLEDFNTWIHSLQDLDSNQRPPPCPICAETCATINAMTAHLLGVHRVHGVTPQPAINRKPKSKKKLARLNPPTDVQESQATVSVDVNNSLVELRKCTEALLVKLYPADTLASFGFSETEVEEVLICVLDYFGYSYFRFEDTSPEMLLDALQRNLKTFCAMSLPNYVKDGLLFASKNVDIFVKDLVESMKSE